MKTLYKIEMFVAIFGILAFALALLSSPFTFTGYVSGLNLTIYSQNLNVLVDGSQSYTLATEGENLQLESFMLDGEVIGKGRVQIFLDNGKGQQYLVYENIVKKPDFNGPHLLTGIPSITAGITGNSISDINGVNETRGVWLVMQPKQPVKYEFLPLAENEEAVEGEFYSECKETCNLEEGVFNAATYDLIFRLEQGTIVRLKEIKYILQTLD